MEILLKSSIPAWVSFDGRVLEVFFESSNNLRFHIRQITSIQLAPPDKHGKQELTFETTGSGKHSVGYVPPSEAQELVAAVVQAIHAP